MEFSRHQRQCPPGIVNAHERHVGGQRSLRRPFSDDRDCACGDSRRHELQAIGFAAGDGDEGVAGFDRAAVRGHPTDVEIGKVRVEFRIRRQNFAKLHGPVD